MHPVPRRFHGGKIARSSGGQKDRNSGGVSTGKIARFLVLRSWLARENRPLTRRSRGGVCIGLAKGWSRRSSNGVATELATAKPVGQATGKQRRTTPTPRAKRQHLTPLIFENSRKFFTFAMCCRESGDSKFLQAARVVRFERLFAYFFAISGIFREFLANKNGKTLYFKDLPFLREVRRGIEPL